MGILPLHQLHPPVLLPALGGVIRAARLGVPQPLGLEARAIDLVVVEEILPHRGRAPLAQCLIRLGPTDVAVVGSPPTTRPARRRVEITDRRTRMGIESWDRERLLVGWRSW
jgi:hypothetical protein